jgi:hypothetical protein
MKANARLSNKGQCCRKLSFLSVIVLILFLITDFYVGLKVKEEPKFLQNIDYCINYFVE